MKKVSIADSIRTLLDPVAESMGYWLWDVEYVKEGATWYLRITIEKEDGITIDDCECFHRAIDPILDEANPIESSYTLEVSSPGLERDLKTDIHIEACEGWDVEVHLFAPVDGAKIFTGVLEGLNENGQVVITMKNGQEKVFDRAAVSQLKTIFDFDSLKGIKETFEK